MTNREPRSRKLSLEGRSADVFISYKRSERPRIAAMAKALKTLSVDVWYDIGLRPGELFDEVIEEQARAARSVIVFWTRACFDSEDSGYVRREAGIGYDRGVLAPATLEPLATLTLPHPFNKVHTEDLSHWFRDCTEETGWGALDDPAFLRMLDTLGSRSLLDRPGLTELARVHSSLSAAGEPSHLAAHTSLERAVASGRTWLSAFSDDPAAETLARTLVDYEYALVGARLHKDYGKLLRDWTPPGAEAMQRERLQLFEIDRLKRSCEGKDAMISDLTRQRDLLQGMPHSGPSVNRPAELVRGWRDFRASKAHGSYVDEDGTLPAPVSSVAFTNDGKLLVTSSWDGLVRIWDANDLTLVRSLKGHKDAIHSASFSSDSSRIASASDDDTVRVWDTATGECLLILEHGGLVAGATFSTDNTRIVTACWDESAYIWSAQTGQRIAILRHGSFVNWAAISSRGDKIATAADYGTIKLWNAATGAHERSIRTNGAHCRTVSFSPDDTLLVTGSDNGSVMLWDVAKLQKIAEMNHSGTVYSAAFSPDGQFILTASEDCSVRVWTRDGKCISSIEREDGFFDACFHPTAQLIATAGYEGIARLWKGVSD